MKRKSKYSLRKSGQIETFGLAFIVILIIVGFFIYISFRSHQTQDNPQKDFTNDKLANDFVLSILDVSVEGCEVFSVEDLIKDCARDHRIKCGEEDSCIAVNRSIVTMLNQTFMSRRIKFRFYSSNIYFDSKDLINVNYLNCTPTSRQGQRGVATIPLYPAPGSVYLNINICYQ